MSLTVRSICRARTSHLRGVWPVRLRRAFTKWEASENPARRPISAVVDAIEQRRLKHAHGEIDASLDQHCSERVATGP